MVNSPSSQPAVAMEPKRRPRTNQTTVSVNFDDADPLTPHRSRSSMKFEVAECIETKTVTTTTTTKRSYPPFLLKDSKPLSSLDSKEYPLAQKPTPPELANFTFSLDHEDVASWPGNDSFEQQPEVRPCAVRPRAPLTLSDHTALQSQQSTSDESTQEIKTEPGLEMFQDEGEFRTGPRNSAEKLSRRFRKMDFHKMKTRSNSPVVSGSIKKSAQRASKSHSQSLSHAVSDKLRRSLGSLSRKDRDRENTAGKLSGGLPVTPDASEVSLVDPNRSLRPRRSHLDSFETPDSDPNESQQSFFELSSPTGSDSHTIFGNNVATPPVTDADAEPLTDADESLQQSIRALHHPRPIDTLAAQDASLPSPRLSPTLQAARLHADEPEGDEDDDDALLLHGGSQMTTMDDETAVSNALVELPPRAVEPYDGSHNTMPNLMDSRAMLETFDCMPPEMKSFMMYQFLRRCSRKTLHVVAKVVNPALKCDILKDLPLELSLHVLSYLDHRDLCRAAQVSTHWRNLIDSNETGWKDLFDRDGFVLTTGELEKAIKEGWGWQDPVGPEGCERDYSLQNRLTSSESELLRSSSKPEPPQKLRSSKRKRAAMHGLGSDRSKRRASAQDHVRDEKAHAEFKPEGPISAANAAALAVPDPLVGLASLRKLHLFKSLYRRHHMIRQSWTSGKVKPSHVAFAAHPRHVITCLQFDEDKIITGSDDQLIHVYDTNTGKLRKRLEGHEGGVWALQYQGNVLVSGSTDRSVRVWDIEKGLCTQVFYGHTSTVRCLQILMPTDTGKVENGVPVMMPPKPLIITGSRDSQLRVWRLPEAGSRRYIQTGPPANDADCPYFIRTLQGHSHSVRAIAAHADTLVSGSYDNTVRVWKISTGETVHVLQGHAQKVYSVVLDTERNRCISGSMDSFVKIWDLETGACTHTLEGHSLLVGLLDLRDERLVSAAADSTLRIWDPESGRCRHTLTAHTGAITCFQHDGRKVISGSDRTLKMWDIRTGECVQDLLTDLSGVWQVRFDERRCVAAVQREGITYVEILDFGAVRDGKSPEELGKRILLNAPDVQRFLDEARDDN